MPVMSEELLAELVSRLDVEISAAKAEVASSGAQLAAAEARLKRLVAAKEVYNSHMAAPAENGRTTRKATLADRIEQTLSATGPATADEIHQKLSATDVNTTRAAITTTLSRMKVARRLTNSSGRWRLVADPAPTI
jgi:hypothetical protein